MYIVAAVIIISLVAALMTVSNYSKKRNPIEIYKLGEELEIESANLLEYGTLQGNTSTEMQILVEDFISEYINYSDIERLYFIFGNETDITFLGYHEFLNENVTIQIDSSPEETISIPAMELTKKDFSGLSFDDNIKIVANDLNYEFKLRAGENFYFVISQEIDAEQYVVSGGNKDD